MHQINTILLHAIAQKATNAQVNLTVMRCSSVVDALNARTKHSASLYSVIYSYVIIIILYSLYDRLALHMLHLSVLSFSK